MAVVANSVHLGVALQSKHDLDGGIAAWRQAVALKPKSAPAHNNLGFALQLKGDFAGAAAEYHRAIDVDRNYIQARCNLADMLINCRDPARRDIGQALQEAETSVKLDPKNGQVWTTLGMSAGLRRAQSSRVSSSPRIQSFSGLLGSSPLRSRGVTTVWICFD